MRYNFPALSGHRRLTNRRGAVFLLAVYLASLMLLVLGGVSLQRSVVDTRAAQLSAQSEKLFWISEATLDRLMTSFRTGEAQAILAQAPEGTRCVQSDITDTQSTTVSGVGSVGYYTLCRTENPTLYSLEIVGQSGNAAQLVSALLAVRDSTVTVQHALFGQRSMTLNRLSTGAVDTAALSLTTSPWLGRDTYGHPIVVTSGKITARGDIASNALGPLTESVESYRDLGEVRDGWLYPLGGGTVTPAPEPTADGSIRYVTVSGKLLAQEVAMTTQQSPVINLVDRSYVGGNVEVAPGTDPSTMVRVSADSTVQGRVMNRQSPFDDLPRIVPADTATDLGALRLSGQSSSRILATGTYKVSELRVSGGATLTTAGPVNLYVTGPVEITGGSKVFGQALVGSLDCDPFLSGTCLTPKNLRIFAKARNTGDLVVIGQDTLVGAALYAPEMDVRLADHSLTVGGVMGGRLTVPGQAGFVPRALATVIYDLDLGRQPILVSPDEQMVTLKLYQLKELTASTSGSANNSQTSSGGTVSTPNQGSGSGWWGGGGGGCTW